MTANWDILNREFDNLIESFQDTDWTKWESNRAARKEMRRSEMLLKAKIQEEKLKLAFQSTHYNELTSNIVFSSDSIIVSSSKVQSNVEHAGENNYALAA
jgi:hypothetical protein